MVSVQQCPFCLREFQSVEEVTHHLVFADCRLQERDVPLQAGREPAIAALRGEVEHRGEDEHPQA